MPTSLHISYFSLLPVPSSSLSLSVAIDSLSSSPNLTPIALTLPQQTLMGLIPTSLPSLTIFSCADAAFLGSGQPPLPLLRHRLSPDRIDAETLASLPFGVQYLDQRRRDRSVFRSFVDLSSFPGPSFTSPGSIFKCMAPAATESFTGAPDKIRSIGYSMIASFLDLQLVCNRTAEMTTFALSDESLQGLGRSFSDYVWVFRRCVVPFMIGGDFGEVALRKRVTDFGGEL